MSDDGIEREGGFVRQVNEAISWGDRKTLADVWQTEARIPSLDEDVYLALIAVAQWGARTALANAGDDTHEAVIQARIEIARELLTRARLYDAAGRKATGDAYADASRIARGIYL